VAVHGEDFVIPASVVLTDGQTDASTMAKTREALNAVPRKKFTRCMQHNIPWPIKVFRIKEAGNSSKT